MRSCPNCGQPVELRARFCPHCGAVNLPPPGPPEGRLLTGRLWADRLLGAGAVLLTLILSIWLTTLFESVWGFLSYLPTTVFFTWIVGYAGLRRRYPALATGIGFTLLAIPALIALVGLGLFAVCMVSLFSGKTKF